MGGGEHILKPQKCTVECVFWIKLIFEIKTTKETKKKKPLLLYKGRYGKRGYAALLNVKA